uniref:Uncharacterized protein n=1 Tax=Sparus aurata TaxID=8175 RepID=A0A671XHP8_SPAAU
MYSVICFDKDEEVEVAPTAWFHEGTCRWPPYKSQGVQRAVKQLEEAQSTWPVHTDARIFYSSGLYMRDQEDEENLSPPKRKTVSLPKAPAIPRPPSSSRHFILMPQSECGFVEVPSSALLKEVLVNQQILMDQQKNIIRMIQDMQRSTNAVTGIPTTNVFPLNDKPALYALERDLGSQPDLRNKLVITLGLVGGATVKETVWRILKQAIKNDLAKTISWRGLNGKVPFEKLHLRAVVTDAVRRNPVCIEATDLSIADAIKRWFYWAGDREGGRKNRLPGASRPTV